MGIVFRQSVKGTIINFSGALLGMIMTYLSTQWLSQQELGVTRNLLTQAVVGSQFVLLGIHTTLFIFITKYPPGDERRPLLITLSLLTPVVTVLFFTIFYFLFKDQIIHLYQPKDIVFVKRYFLWLPLYALLWGYLTLLEHYLSSQMKVAISVFMREVVLRILNIGLLCMFALQIIDFHWFVITGVLIHLIPIILLWRLARKTEAFDLSLKWRAFSRSEYKTIIDFALFHLLLNASMSLLGYIDSLMLPALDKNGMQTLAIYFVALLAISIFLIPYRALVAPVTPILNKAYEDKDWVKVNDLFKRSGINILIVSVAMGLLIALNMPNIALLFGEEYAPITNIVWILLIGRFIDMATGMNNEMLSISKYYRYGFYLTFILLVLVIVFDYLLIPVYGVYGAAWGVTIALVFFNIAKLVIVKRKLNLSPFTNKSFSVLIAGVVTAAVVFNIPLVFNPFVDTIVRSFVIILLYGGLLLLIQPSEDLKNYLSSVRKSKRLF